MLLKGRLLRASLLCGVVKYISLGLCNTQRICYAQILHTKLCDIFAELDTLQLNEEICNNCYRTADLLFIPNFRNNLLFYESQNLMSLFVYFTNHCSV